MMLSKKLPKQRIIDSYIGPILCWFSNFSKEKKLSKINKIIVYRLSAIGDSVLVLPMLKKLKKETNAEIVVICSKENKEIFENQEFIDKIILFHNNTLNPFKILKTIKRIKKEKADIAIDTTQTLNFSAFLSKITSKQNIGFENEKTKIRNKNYDFLTKLSKNRHMVLSYMDLLEHININPLKDMTLISPKYSKKDEENVKKIFKEKKIKDKKIIGIHLSNPEHERRWSIEKWAEVIKYLINKGYYVIAIGTKKEIPVIKNSKKILEKNIKDKKISDKYINLAGEFNLKETFALIEKFEMFLANDGGPVHMSASMNKPTLAIFGPETPKRYAPFNEKSLSVWKGKKSQLNLWDKKRSSENLNLISPDEVKEAVEILEDNLKK